jgi:S-formylglutathione hydrolase FrmB
MSTSSSIIFTCNSSFFHLLKSIVFLILFLTINAFSAEQKIVTIPSAAMGKEFKAAVILPASYAQSHKHYSVIYLLHGFGGDPTVWPGIAPLMQCADSLQLLFVCPDGDNAWYFDSPVRKRSLFATSMVHEVIPFIDSAYRTWAQASGRAVMGLSMGGHGAVTLLAKHPDLFAGACSISGIMDLTEFPSRWELPKLLGSLTENKQRWIDYSCIGQVDLLKGSSKLIILDCGTEDFALRGNVKEHELLQQSGIPHFFYSHPGTHNRHYARKVAAGHLRALSGKLQTAQ